MIPLIKKKGFSVEDLMFLPCFILQSIGLCFSLYLVQNLAILACLLSVF